jgi:RpiR family carbohydrate utilization transcriptional regulator
MPRVKFEESAAVPSALGRIRSRLPSLSPSEMRIAEFVLANPAEIIHMSVAEVAERAGSAESTAVRFCRRVGFTGFQDLKIQLARDTTSLSHYAYDDVEPTDAPGDVLLKVMGFSSRVIQDAASSIDAAVFDDTVAMMSAASEILIIGYGTSQNVALSARDQLTSIGLKVAVPEDANHKHLAARTAAPDSCALLISHTGATRDTIRCAEALHARGVPTAALTSTPQSRLTTVVDRSLVAGGHSMSFRFEALSGRLVHLAVIDALYLALALRDPVRARAALDVYFEADSSWRL